MAHILLVDDHDAVRSALVRYLRLHGHIVTDVASARAALEHAYDPFDVVVTDLKMPGLGGAELVRALRAHDVDAPVILMSGRFPHAEEAAVADFVLQKPFSPEVLCNAIDRVLGTDVENGGVAGA